MDGFRNSTIRSRFALRLARTLGGWFGLENVNPYVLMLEAFLPFL